jgi:hypothetical protein
MTGATLEQAAALFGERWRRKGVTTAKRCVWENVCPKREGPYTTTPASKMTC